MKVGETVRRETIRIGKGMLVLSAVMQACYLLLGWWDISVLLGNLLGGAAAIANFFLMGRMIEQALELEQEEAARLIRSSQLKRNLMMFGAMVLAGILPWFDLYATILPLLFPRSLLLRDAKKQGETEEKREGKRKRRIGL